MNEYWRLRFELGPPLRVDSDTSLRRAIPLSDAPSELLSLWSAGLNLLKERQRGERI